ncbi:MAG: endonuclease III, partial [Candidatus Magasanikbacteria bacterium]|nr:endonuclease III [Candidatus Magasanikbacteria bacterium]
MTKKDRAIIVLHTLKTLYPNIHTHLHFSNPWELLVAVSLSARTTDAQVNKVTKKLFTKYKTLNDYAQASDEDFAQDINSIGLYKSKAQRVVAAAKLMQNVFHGNIPKTIAELITLPGVGRKTANVVLY